MYTSPFPYCVNMTEKDSEIAQVSVMAYCDMMKLSCRKTVS